MKNVLIIGAGGVGAAVAHKCAQNNERLGNICLASRTISKCDDIIRSIEDRNNIQNPSRSITTAIVDAKDVDALTKLITNTQSGIVINVASPHCNLDVIEACLASGAHYIDTSVYEKEGEINAPPPWYANHEWNYRARFAEQSLTGILGIGFDPGAVNVFCAHVRKHLIDDIDSIDIMDVNGGDHGRYFATNFDPETNLREIMEDVIYWEDSGWKTIPCHSKHRMFDFPELGDHRIYSMGHDEIHSLAVNIPARRIEFWMGFGEHYLRVFSVLRNLGLLSGHPVDVEGTQVIPLKVVKALLPDPATLAAGYSGKVCIGCLIKGRNSGSADEVFIYSTCSHQDCYADVGSQAISYTTAVPAVTAALLIADGSWEVGQLVNAEELDPDPFMKLMPKIGIDWHVEDRPASRR